MEIKEQVAIKEQVRRYILAHHFSVDRDEDFTYETDLVNSGILDSFALVDIVGFVEQAFGIKVDLDDFVLKNFSTLEMVERFVVEKQRQSV